MKKVEKIQKEKEDKAKDRQEERKNISHKR